MRVYKFKKKAEVFLEGAASITDTAPSFYPADDILCLYFSFSFSSCCSTETFFFSISSRRSYKAIFHRFV